MPTTKTVIVDNKIILFIFAVRCNGVLLVLIKVLNKNILKQKIIKLEIPKDAKRTSATSRKCRCNKAKVLGIYDYNHNLLEDKEVASDIDRDFIYRVGEFVEVKDFDEDRWHECSTGIHFFINFEEAVNY